MKFAKAWDFAADGHRAKRNGFLPYGAKPNTRVAFDLGCSDSTAPACPGRP